MSGLNITPIPSSPSVLSSSPTTPTGQLSTSTQIMSLQPPSTQPVKMSSNTFVHKLYNMVVDKQYQHLIAWNYTGSSFIVCNIMEFSRDVLPKHFKHNNFSSFVRQLNMYGFHKVNKSPRGHRTLAENQIWEFSHPKFLRGRPDLLDDIKRKAMESETLRRETGDLHAHIAMMQATQNDLSQQIRQLHENFSEVIRELGETKRKQNMQQNYIKSIWDLINNGQGTSTTIPFDFNFESFEIKSEPERPPIYITSPENNYILNNLQQSTSSNQNHSSQRPSTPLTVNTNLTSHTSQSSQSTSPHTQIQLSGNSFLNNAMLTGRVTPLSPSHFSSYNQAVNTPLPPSPSPGSPMAHISDDDMDGNSSLYCTSPAGSHAGSEYSEEITWGE